MIKKLLIILLIIPRISFASDWTMENLIGTLESCANDEKDAYDQIIAYLTGEEDKEGEDKEDKESEEKVKDETKKVENPVEKIAGFKSDSNTTIEGLEEDAARLIKTQKTLKENMAELQPMLKKAENIMSDLKNLNA